MITRQFRRSAVSDSKELSRSYAGKRINVHVLLDGSVEFFFKGEKIVRFDFKTACAFGLYRTNSKPDMFRYGPLTRSLNLPHQLAHPDIFVLPLT